jgi:hypothetical protein
MDFEANFMESCVIHVPKEKKKQKAHEYDSQKSLNQSFNTILEDHLAQILRNNFISVKKSILDILS